MKKLTKLILSVAVLGASFACTTDATDDLGIKLDKAVNDATHGDEVELTVPGCPVRAFVVPTNEELAIARDTKEIVEKL